MMHRLPLFALVTLVGAAACAPTLSTMEPARTVPAGHLQVTTSVDVTETSGEIREVIDEVQQVMENRGGGAPMTPGEVALAASATSAALVQPPAVGYQLSAAYGISQRVELGARLSMNSVRAWSRYQFLRARPGWYGAIGLGVSTYLYGFPVQQLVDEIRIEEFSRWDFDVPLHLGFSNRYVHVWGGPKLVLSSYDAGFTTCTRKRAGRCRDEAQIGLSGTAAYVGGQLGLAVGYKSIWVAAELTVMRLGTSAELDVDSSGGSDTERFDREGLVVSPAVGLITWF